MVKLKYEGLSPNVAKLEEWFSANSGVLTRFAERWAPSYGEDLVREAYVRDYNAARKPNFVIIDETLKAWVYTIISNLAKNLHRDQRRRRRAVLFAHEGHIKHYEDMSRSEYQGMVDGYDARASIPPRDSVPKSDSEIEQILRDELRKAGVPERRIEIFTNRIFRDMKYGELADMFGIPLGTVKSNLNRVREEARTRKESIEARL